MEENNDTVFIGGKLIKDDNILYGIKIFGQVKNENFIKVDSLIKFALKNNKALIDDAKGRIVLLIDYSNNDESLITSLVDYLNRKYSSFLMKLLFSVKIKISSEEIQKYKMDIRFTGFEQSEFRWLPLDYIKEEPLGNFRTSKNIQNKNETAHILEYQLFPPVNEDLANLYGKYLELDDLGKTPSKKWLDELEKMIAKIGNTVVVNHLEIVIKKMVEFQNAHNSLEKRIKEEEDRSGKLRPLSYFEPIISYSEPPTHYYFYTSSTGRYLKGLINTVRLAKSDKLLSLLEYFAIGCPFQSKGVSQAPTGLYVYDIFEIFFKFKTPQTIKSLFLLKNSIKQKRPKKRIEKYLEEIALLKGISYDELQNKYA